MGVSEKQKVENELIYLFPSETAWQWNGRQDGNKLIHFLSETQWNLRQVRNKLIHLFLFEWLLMKIKTSLK